jgi:hypothetical protein
MAELRHRATPDLELRNDGDGRTIFGILAPVGQTAQVDDGRGPFLERFMPGAFTRTIRERGARVKMLANHERRQWPLGRWSVLREDAAGLYGEGKISKTQAGDEALELIRDGALDAFSVGFQVVREGVDRGDNARLVLEARLHEVSLVAFPAYEGAVLQGVRSLTPYDPSTDREKQRYALSIKGLLK